MGKIKRRIIGPCRKATCNIILYLDTCGFVIGFEIRFIYDHTVTMYVNGISCTVTSAVGPTDPRNFSLAILLLFVPMQSNQTPSVFCLETAGFWSRLCHKYFIILRHLQAAAFVIQPHDLLIFIHTMAAHHNAVETIKYILQIIVEG